MKALIDGRPRALTELVGEGGEALVFALGRGRVAKIYKAAPNARKLEALLERPVPACVVGPEALTRDPKTGAVNGYVMPRIEGEPLAAYTQITRPGRDSNVALALLRRLHTDLRAIHRAGLVVGDLNDMNVLVTPDGVPRWIDADSYAFAGHPCTVFSERYLDPRLCDSPLVPTRPYDEASDWYAWCARALELLVCLHPYAGTHRLTLRERTAARLTVFSPEVRRPKAIPPLEVLPEPWRAQLRAVFESRATGFPQELLEHLSFMRCPRCALEIAGGSCPRCPTLAPPIGSTRVRVRHVPVLPPLARPRVDVSGGALFVDGREIGRVVAARTSAWLGERFGLALMRLSPDESGGTLTLGAVFVPHRRGLLDSLRFPCIAGRVRDVTCVFSDDHAWLMYERESAGKRLRGCYLVSARGEHVAHSEGEDVPWLASLGSQAGSGAVLFCPSDEGIMRVEARQGALVTTRVFTDTAAFVSTQSRLSCSRDGIAVSDGSAMSRLLSLEVSP